MTRKDFCLVAHILPVRQRTFHAPASPPPQATALRVVNRQDDRAAAIIDEGVRYLLFRGSNAAVDFLCEQGISLRIIGRVLFRPHLRRARG
ncbi:hypothetical protein GTP55_15170 [Duganella sp. FT109W]|uniref:Dinitrogenase iron-molybdenum cofactor biosynthesis domain-containing protein n=1 Tax=Duganella margarita TaxID=2692170 RepID=A0ABW9WK89_9BURK|nr:hypothetical protein [Duganella margarita]MYN40714.1 hypothetical protein [Duganella margarita]